MQEDLFKFQLQTNQCQNYDKYLIHYKRVIYGNPFCIGSLIIYRFNS